MGKSVATFDDNLDTTGQDQGTTSGNYVRQHSLGSLLRSALRVYWGHLRPIFLTYILPTFPILVAQTLAQSTHMLGLYFGIMAVGMVVSFFAAGAITITISDICLGNAPNVRRSYGRLFQNRLWLKLLGTSMLAGLAIVAGMILLLVPGFIAMVMFTFVSAIVVLERLTGVRALKRSAALVKGFFWRTAGRLGLLILIMYGVMACAGVVLVAVVTLLASFGETGWIEYLIGVVMAALTQGLAYPVFFSAVILMYYDLRARKEAYDVAQLEEDLMR